MNTITNIFLLFSVSLPFHSLHHVQNITLDYPDRKMQISLQIKFVTFVLPNHTYLPTCLSFSLSISLSIYLSVYLSVCLSVCLSICVDIHLILKMFFLKLICLKKLCFTPCKAVHPQAWSYKKNKKKKMKTQI